VHAPEGENPSLVSQRTVWTPSPSSIPLSGTQRTLRLAGDTTLAGALVPKVKSIGTVWPGPDTDVL